MLGDRVVLMFIVKLRGISNTMLHQISPLPFMSLSFKCLLVVIVLLAASVQAQTKHEQFRDDLHSLTFLVLGNPAQPPKLTGEHRALMKRAFSDEALVALMDEADEKNEPNHNELVALFYECQYSLQRLQTRYVAAFQAKPNEYGVEYVSMMDFALTLSVGTPRSQNRYATAAAVLKNGGKKNADTQLLANMHTVSRDQINLILNRLANEVHKGQFRDASREVAVNMLKRRLTEYKNVLNQNQRMTIELLAQIKP